MKEVNSELLAFRTQLAKLWRQDLLKKNAPAVKKILRNTVTELKKV